MPTALAYTFTSEPEIKRLYSVVGVELQVLDLKNADVATYWSEVVADATTEMLAYLAQLHTAADLYNNYWVRQRATWIAAYRLSQRSGNPPQFADRYLQILEELEKVKNGDLIIPDVPVRYDLAPSMSNVYVDARYEYQKIRTNPSINVGESSGRQHINYLWPIEWF